MICVISSHFAASLFSFPKEYFAEQEFLILKQSNTLHYHHHYPSSEDAAHIVHCTTFSALFILLGWAGLGWAPTYNIPASASHNVT